MLVGVREQLLHIRRNRRSGGAHLLRRRANAGSVEHLERPKLPVVAGLHRLIDLDDVVRDHLRRTRLAL